NVSATVTDASTSLIITDLNGQEISSVNFHHEINAGNTTDSLNIDVLAKASGLNDSTQLESKFGNSDTAKLTLSNGTDTLTSNLAHEKMNYDTNNGGIVVNVSSTLEGEAVAGSYATATEKLTFTYNKSIR
ncbi:MAG: hypothetical protein ACRC0G_11665, partial [Fusobacteriaceae bacterium]